MVFSFFYCVASTGSATVLYLLLLPMPEPVEGTFLFSSSLWFRLRSVTVLLPVPEPVEGTFLFLHRLFRLSSITVLYLLLLPMPELVEVILLRWWFLQAQSPSYIYYYSRCLSLSKAPKIDIWACRRHILIPLPYWYLIFLETSAFRIFWFPTFWYLFSRVQFPKSSYWYSIR